MTRILTLAAMVTALLLPQASNAGSVGLYQNGSNCGTAIPTIAAGTGSTQYEVCLTYDPAVGGDVTVNGAFFQYNIDMTGNGAMAIAFVEAGVCVACALEDIGGGVNPSQSGVGAPTGPWPANTALVGLLTLDLTAATPQVITTGAAMGANLITEGSFYSYYDYINSTTVFEITGGGGPSTPEPTTLVLVGMGLAGLAFVRRRSV